MSTIVISHDTALAWWRAAGKAEVSGTCDANAVLAAATRDLGSGANGFADALPQLPRPLDLLTASRNQRRTTRELHVHCILTELPEGALVEAEQPPECAMGSHGLRTFVCTPEFCFVQMAAQLSDRELVELGFELTGLYARTPEGSFVARDPITTPEQLAAFAENARNMTGAKRARRLARSVIAGSSSPDHTHMAMLAHLPRSLGGMGTKPPLFGQRIEAPDVVARILGSRTLTPGLAWPDAHTVLEYDRREWASEQAWEDYSNRKQSAYRMLGIDCISLRRAQLDDPDTIRALFDEVNRRCGTRLKPANEKQRARQDALLAWLRGGDSANGRFGDSKNG